MKVYFQTKFWQEDTYLVEIDARRVETVAILLVDVAIEQSKADIINKKKESARFQLERIYDFLRPLQSERRLA